VPQRGPERPAHHSGRLASERCQHLSHFLGQPLAACRRPDLAQHVQDQFQRILYGPYNLGLAQYGYTGNAFISGTVFFTNDFTGQGIFEGVSAKGSIPNYQEVPNTINLANLMCTPVSTVQGFQTQDAKNVILAAAPRGWSPRPRRRFR